MDKMKLCPFCGKQPELLRDERWPGNSVRAVRAYYVSCVNSDCVIFWADNKYFRSAEKAIKAWNRRASEAE